MICAATTDAFKTYRFDTREEWLAARRLVVGSSDAAALFGYGYSCQSIYSIWLEKTEGIAPTPTEDDQRRFDYGHMAEPFIRSVFEYEQNLTVHSDPSMTIRVSKEHPFMGASLDGWCVDEDGEAVTELKFLGVHQRNEVKDGIHDKFAIQIQHQLAVTGWKNGYLCVLVGNEPFIHKVPRNERIIQAIRKQSELFWKTVENRVPPEIDGSEATAKAVVMQYPPRDDESTVELPEKFNEIVASMESHTAKKKEHEELARQEKSRILAAMEGADIGYVVGGVTVANRKHGKGRRLKKLDRPPLSLRKQLEAQGIEA
jgi:putative phage-type endonuclease